MALTGDEYDGACDDEYDSACDDEYDGACDEQCDGDHLLQSGLRLQVHFYVCYLKGLGFLRCYLLLYCF